MKLQLFLILSLLPLLLIPSFAQAPPALTVHTDDNRYKTGVPIIISGWVRSIDDQSILMHIFCDDNLMDTEEIAIAEDKTWAHIIITDDLWQNGVCTVRMSYQDQIAETKFDYTFSDTIELDPITSQIVIDNTDNIQFFGTGSSGSALTIQVFNSIDELIHSRTSGIYSGGNWTSNSPILIIPNGIFGEYKAVISNGYTDSVNFWTVESDKVIIITPSSLKFKPGEIMKFNGTALPNNSMEVILEDPLGKEVFADIIQIDDFGYLEFEFLTTQNSTKGTYTLIATQGIEKEFIFVGIGQLPTIPSWNLIN